MTFKQHKELLTNCTYLEDAGTVVEGYKIWGTPYQPLFHGWAFNRGDAQRRELFSQIPDGTDIVMCHGPPYGIRDRILNGANVGCPILEEIVLKRVKPLMTVFGHIHEDRGVSKKDNTLFVNAAMCTVRYSCSNPAIIVDLPRRTPPNAPIPKILAPKPQKPIESSNNFSKPIQKKTQGTELPNKAAAPPQKTKVKLNSALEKFVEENEVTLKTNPKSGKAQLEIIEQKFPPPSNLQEMHAMATHLHANPAEAHEHECSTPTTQSSFNNLNQHS